MRNIYTSRPRSSSLLNRLALLSALVLAGIVSVDVVFFKFRAFDRAEVTDMEMLVSTAD